MLKKYLKYLENSEFFRILALYKNTKGKDFLKSNKVMARFQIGDKIEFLRRDEVIRKGVVTNGPYNIEKVDHYNVRWDWVEQEDSMFIGPDKIDLISDLSSEKYRYRLSN